MFCSRSKNSQDTSNMLPEEFALYESLRQVLDNYRDGILGNILNSQLPEIKLHEQKDLKTEDKTNTLSILMLSDLPEFVGPDLQVYGPFQKGEKHELPKLVADMLVSTEQAKNESS